MEKHTITAIIPNYNYADFINERVDSILKQTYPVAEIIILDDASSDNSVKVIKEKIRKVKFDFPKLKIKLIVNKENSGGCVFSQWQKGVQEARSEYFWIAEADDSANKHFLETAMQKFDEHPTSVLFYSDSCRIDQNGRITSNTCMDWADMWGKGRWKEDFFNDGEDEIVNYLGETNTILNVSSVVWKNKPNILKIFDEAKQFKVAGDWYIYTRVLEDGDIVYSAKPLNKYRKHNKGSASTVVKLSAEYKEVVRVQDRVAQKYGLSYENLEWQKTRRRGMGMVENERNVNHKGRIAWFVPDFVDGSGGHRTIFQNINALIGRGYACDLYVKPIWRPLLPREIYDNIRRWYEDFDGDVFNDYTLARDYDMIVATAWDTVEPVLKTGVEKKMYFIQDYEPWFFPMGTAHLTAQKSYHHGLAPVTIGHWLANKIKKESGQEVECFDFCADLSRYYKKNEIKKENAICFVGQPIKPRRCMDIGMRALQIVQAVRPDVKIYVFGSPKMKMYNIKATHLGILSVEKCNDLYNCCKVGLSLSTTNPSRVPFEMMAAGLPVVELGLENNLYDLPEDGCLLAEPSPEAIANAILKILDDDKLAKRMSLGGAQYMKNYPLTKGYEQFGEIVDEYLKGKKYADRNNKTTYNKKLVGKIKHMPKLPPEVYYKTMEEIETEKKAEEMRKAREKDAEWRKNLTIPQRIYLKIRWILFGR